MPGGWRKAAMHKRAESRWGSAASGFRPNLWLLKDPSQQSGKPPSPDRNWRPCRPGGNDTENPLLSQTTSYHVKRAAMRIGRDWGQISCGPARFMEGLRHRRHWPRCHKDWSPMLPCSSKALIQIRSGPTAQAVPGSARPCRSGMQASAASRSEFCFANKSSGSRVDS